MLYAIPATQRPSFINSLASSTIPPLAHTAPAILAFLLSIKFNKCALASGPLHLLFSFWNTLLPRFTSSGSCSSVTCCTYERATAVPHPSTPNPFIQFLLHCAYHYQHVMCLFAFSISFSERMQAAQRQGLSVQCCILSAWHRAQ